MKINQTEALDAADCCVSMDEARDLIRRRERYVDTIIDALHGHMDQRHPQTIALPVTVEALMEKLRPIASNPSRGSAK